MGKQKHSDEYYLEMALAEAQKGRFTTSPNPAVGCVIVRDSKILGMGYHHCAGQPHAEIMALRAADYQVNNATAYVTLEPCSHYGRTPPCAKALIDAGISRVVIGSTDPNPKVSGRGIKMLEESGIEVKIASGKIAKKCVKLNRAFFKSIKSGRPFTILKYGMSLDGKVALSTGESKWITNNACRSDVQRLRLWSDALITSHKTITSDNPKLNVRLEDVPIKLLTGLDTTLITQPIKVIIDSHAQLLPNYSLKDLDKFAIFTSGENYIVVGTNESFADPNAAPKCTSKVKKAAQTSAEADATTDCMCCAAVDGTESKASAATKSRKAKGTSSSKSADAKAAASKTTADKSTATKSTAAKSSATKSTAAKATADKASKSRKAATTKKADRKRVEVSASIEPKAKTSRSALAAKNKVASQEMCVSWHINQDKVIARGANFVVEQWSERVKILVVPFALGTDGKEHASLNAVMDFLGSKDIRVAMVEAGSNLGSSFLEQDLVDECYCYIAPMLLGQNAKSAFAIAEPKRLANAMKFDKCKVRTFGDNIGLVLTKKRSSKKKA
ncbi:MAG: bifunctional diaminohydroxyphosphoribosylaminopyrimidine deaminase/5-amino-6-(5-phosphoribosylamino)uracil reductase RibD [Anaerobiospirillum succiniciproducens]|uniref:bifunctional diaminohydroxyphosphoribosylaminopyrimidine deaminase/5-amino-6-(5-phosphoribosylamino)uracil reductase RibD n=1 Tax=Anaerobiospirillum succiniciproducens TaxID=13335 RepID=UPI0026DB4090|nr:bifunctional diaminohydroxyphosphoribosylaminopyrimidine deaminase/5-amino-6-(5-phosphoribosylamino)uracil reductase RibD [Anaerobiospirillum succiniciproducens]MDO4675187.1 bifunctional diaminohydroxyphosphoribosylaminopyrimidine deaminase/5-amino-6-(5-phosphoribosylamino)uracil reductase RibD [Anaerobiospirillum succiniciproducens]